MVDERVPRFVFSIFDEKKNDENTEVGGATDITI